MKRNTAIDIGRFFASFMVVCLHTKFPIKLLGPFVADIAKFSVPFFLLTSGFYLYDVENEKFKAKVKKSIKKLLRILLEASLVYGTLRVLKKYYFEIDISNQHIRLFEFFVFNDTKFTEHLWYLFAVLYVLIILLVISRVKRLDLFLKLAPIYILIHVVFCTLSRNYFEDPYLYELNWLATAMPFISIGLLIRKKKLFKSFKNTYLLRSLIGFVFLIFIEHYLFKLILGKGPGVLSIFLFSITLFLFLAKNPKIFHPKIDNFIANIGKNHALDIYIYHVLIRNILTLSGASLALNNSVVIFLLSLLFSIALQSLKSGTYCLKKRVKIDKEIFKS
jgi:surface polysaccharide O-acyltransferase-like enzyme